MRAFWRRLAIRLSVRIDQFAQDRVQAAGVRRLNLWGGSAETDPIQQMRSFLVIPI